jgi:hypothetical protein
MCSSAAAACSSLHRLHDALNPLSPCHATPAVNATDMRTWAAGGSGGRRSAMHGEGISGMGECQWEGLEGVGERSTSTSDCEAERPARLNSLRANKWTV